MKPCLECNAEMRDDALFCGKCGARVVESKNNHTLFGMAAVDLNEFPDHPSPFVRKKQYATSSSRNLDTPITVNAISRPESPDKLDNLDFSVPNFQASSFNDPQDLPNPTDIDTTHHTQVWGAIRRDAFENQQSNEINHQNQDDSPSQTPKLHLRNSTTPTDIEPARRTHTTDKEIKRRNAVTGISLSNLGGRLSRQERNNLVILITSAAIFLVLLAFAAIIIYLMFFR